MFWSSSVFAGGAIIAKQGRYVENNDSINWTTTDPVTGSTASPSSGNLSTGETEPLGQTLHLFDPAGLPDPQSSQIVMGSASDMQWQCNAGPAFYGGFSGMPFHCQQKALMAAGSTLPWEHEKDSDPKKIPAKAPNKPGPPTLKQPNAAEKARARALAATQKPSPQDNEADDEGSTTGGPSLPDDFQDASVSGVSLGSTAGKEALGACVVQLLQGFYADYLVDGRGVKIAADARFVEGISSLYKIPGKLGIGVVPGAMTMGLYNIHFENIDLTSPTWDNLYTIAEELQHGVQFIEMWQRMADIPATTVKYGGHNVGREPMERHTRTIPARRPTYGEAQTQWGLEYASAAIEAFRNGQASYDNHYERTAKARASTILDDIKIKYAEKFVRRQKICP